MPVDPDTARELIHRVFDLQRVIRCLSSTELKHGDLGVALQGVLRMIAEYGGRAVDLAGKLGVSAPVLSRHLAELEGLGLVERRRDPEDRRAQLVALTEAGRAQLEDVEEHRIARLQGYLAGWDEDQASAAVTAVGQLSEALHAGSHRMRPAHSAPQTTQTTTKEEALAAR
ncbi:MarR family transcriptional regulator [Sinomonas sp. ASV486]|uniref:MarR family winged helix-turn-helix transcriptional regulator n=1 Tax=Sinomonas sp. ASV486 TaxID=3051170 RepID=UPI0027DDBF5B|nr:MarR family transcriptional regulator [Sinomonas sp. ASV486]MDQ4491936.1 MarR family transcriptional regulator [Sinomonas sp. ASV486]